MIQSSRDLCSVVRDSFIPDKSAETMIFPLSLPFPFSPQVSVNFGPDAVNDQVYFKNLYMETVPVKSVQMTTCCHCTVALSLKWLQ